MAGLSEAAGVGATLAIGKHGVFIQHLEPRGTAQTSGMLRVGDIIIKIDDTILQLDGMPAAKAHRLLQGPAGTTVRIRYRRPPNTFDMNCTLLRETGTEHILKEEHGGWKTIDLTDNRARDEEARRRAEGIYSGQEKINLVAFHGEHADKMTKEELAAYQAWRKAEDEANCDAADKYVAGLEDRDKKGGRGNAQNSWLPLPFPKHHDPAHTTEANTSLFGLGAGGGPKTGSAGTGQGIFGWSDGGKKKTEKEKDWLDWMPAHKDETREKKGKLLRAVAFGSEADVNKAAVDYKIAKTHSKLHDFLHGKPTQKDWWDFGTNSEAQRKKPGQHHWPWEPRPEQHDSRFLDKDVPMPWDVWCTAKKDTR